MEFLDSVWQISIIALVAGVMIGALAYRLFGPSTKQSDEIQTELDQAREELNNYRAEVNQHFNKTSELVNDLTQNYVKVYQHLAEGSESLGDSKNFNNLLEQQPGRVSIAVDDDSFETTETAADKPVDPVVTEADPGESIDEHAEPFITPDSSNLADMAPDPAEAKTQESSGSPDDQAEAAPEVETPDATRDDTDSSKPKDKEKVKADAT